jgi:hypothetical protein
MYEGHRFGVQNIGLKSVLFQEKNSVEKRKAIKEMGAQELYNDSMTKENEGELLLSPLKKYSP